MIKAEDLKKAVDEIKNNNAILIDVREKKEWDASHIDIAKSFPLSQIAQGKFPEDFPLKKKIYIHCEFGTRAKVAEALIKKLTPNVQVLEIPFVELKKSFS